MKLPWITATLRGRMTALTRPTPSTRRVPLPRIWPVRAADVLALVAGNALLIAAMWIRHGGLHLFDSPAGALTAVGEIAALGGTYAALLQLLLMSRSPWLDQLFGMDRIAGWHRWLGFATLWLLVGHGAFTILGFSLGDGSSFWGEAWTMATTYPFTLMAFVSLGLFVAVAVTSIRAARRRLSYETWYGIHLYAYLAVILAVGHQLVVGADFAADPVARAYWIALYLVVGVLILVFRFGQPIATSLRHRLRIAAVVPEAAGVVSVYIGGRGLEALSVRAGQYFVWRFLTARGWWRAHPFSLSAAPNGQYLRVTIKDLGDYTRELQALRVGTRVVVEGPYGVLTGARRRQPGVVLVAGGIGITPLRALLEELPAHRGRLTLLYRARRWDDVVFRDELDELARLRGATVHYLVGRRGRELNRDPLGPAELRRLVPDIARRDVYLCGPLPMMDAVRRHLGALRVPRSQIHLERFAY
jgi:predicted ferric reductase